MYRLTAPQGHRYCIYIYIYIGSTRQAGRQLSQSRKVLQYKEQNYLEQPELREFKETVLLLFCRFFCSSFPIVEPPLNGIVRPVATLLRSSGLRFANEFKSEHLRTKSSPSGVYICKSVVNHLRHGNYICKSEGIYLNSSEPSRDYLWLHP